MIVDAEWAERRIEMKDDGVFVLSVNLIDSNGKGNVEEMHATGHTEEEIRLSVTKQIVRRNLKEAMEAAFRDAVSKAPDRLKIPVTLPVTPPVPAIDPRLVWLAKLQRLAALTAAGVIDALPADEIAALRADVISGSYVPGYATKL